MKKILIYILILITSCFILPAIFSNQDKTKETIVEKTNEKEEEKINEDKNKKSDKKESKKGDKKESKIGEDKEYKIKLLHGKTGEVEEVNLEKYLLNVVSAEMPADFEKEALKAQAIVARTYTIYKKNNKKHENADICDDSKCCQAWISKEERLSRWEEEKRKENWNKIEQAINETKGQIITYKNEPINAFFHSNSGGKTEIPVNVWGGNNYPYLQVVETSGEEEYKQYYSDVEYSYEEFIEKIKTKYSDLSINIHDENEIKIIEYTESGRVRTVKIGNHNISGVEVRNMLKLKSTNFEIEKSKEKIKFLVKGYGHGVGMSQTGADSLAKQGKSAKEIINHFYKDIEIKNLSEIF